MVSRAASQRRALRSESPEPPRTWVVGMPAALNIPTHHEQSAQPHDADPAVRRAHQRHPFLSLQWVAPCPQSGLPDPGSFQQVHCHDISACGISYDVAAPPTATDLIFALKSGPHTTYLKAHVVNSVQVVEGTSVTFRIGCEFIERMEVAGVKPTA
jgi:hypothetical protein